MSHEREYLPAWFLAWEYLDHCRYCGHRTTSNSVWCGRQEHNRHVDECARKLGIGTK